MDIPSTFYHREAYVHSVVEMHAFIYMILQDKNNSRISGYTPLSIPIQNTH